MVSKESIGNCRSSSDFNENWWKFVFKKMQISTEKKKMWRLTEIITVSSFKEMHWKLGHFLKRTKWGVDFMDVIKWYWNMWHLKKKKKIDSGAELGCQGKDDLQISGCFSNYQHYQKSSSADDEFYHWCITSIVKEQLVVEEGLFPVSV